jgi:hypothetical protein
MRLIPISAGVVAAALLAAFLPIEATQGQSTHMHQHATAPAARSATAAYAPGLGEVMSLQQMRHSKLWFAGSALNWELATYELDELGEGFDDVAKLFPTHDGVPLGPMVRTITGREIPDLAKAIAARDGAKFASAFDALTAACNACPQSAKHGFIVIQRPASLPYSNQSFTPAAH